MDGPKVKVFPHGRQTAAGEVVPGGRPEVSLKDRGLELVFVFEDISGDGEVAELRLLPDTDSLEPRVLRRFAPQAELYLSAARAAMKWNRHDLQGAVEALREIGRPGRGHGDDFYRVVGQHYDALVAEGEPHPVKALSKIHHVTISAASRWVKEARRRKHIKQPAADNA